MTVTQALEFGVVRLADLCDNVSLFPKRRARFDDRDACLFIRRVGKARIGPRAAFDQAVISEFLELSGAVGRHRHTVFALEHFFGCPDFHLSRPPFASFHGAVAAGLR